MPHSALEMFEHHVVIGKTLYKGFVPWMYTIVEDGAKAKVFGRGLGLGMI